MKTGKPDTNRPLSYPRHQMNRLYRPRFSQDQMSSSGNQGNFKYTQRPNSQVPTTTTPSDHSIASSSHQNRMTNPQTSSNLFLFNITKLRFT